MIYQIFPSILGFLGFIIIPLFIYALPAVPLALAMWFIGRRRAEWLKKEFACIFIPFVVWFLLFIFFPNGSKTMSNFIAEPLYIGFIGACILLPRLSRKAPTRRHKLLITLTS